MRVRRWAKKVALVCALLLAAGTAFSFVYNATTADVVAPPAGLRYVQTADISTRYREWGSTGRSVVLVHGFVESADTWADVAPLLAAAGYHVLALDLDGFGYTQRVAPYDVDHLTRQLLAFLSVMHLAKPLLVGHSSGAAIVASAALRAPAAVGALMFLDGDGLPTGAGARTAGTALLIEPYRTSLLRLLVRSDALYRAAYREACGPTCPPLDAAGIARWRRPLQMPGAEAALWAMARNGVLGIPADRLAGLARLGMPKSVVFGSADDTFNKDSPAQTARRIGAPSPTLIAGARHLTPVSSPQAVTAAVVALAQRVAAGTSGPR